VSQYRPRKFGKFLQAGSVLAQAGACAFLLSACAVSSPLAVQSTRADIAAQNMQIAIALPDDGEQTLKARFAAALMGSVSSSRLAISPDGQLVADYAISTGSAEVGVLSSQGGQSSENGQDEPVWIAPPRAPKRFDECEAMVLRGSLLLIDRNTGIAVYRGTGTMTDCDFDDDDLREMADGLIADYAASQ
jgi:hypothetical protein